MGDDTGKLDPSSPFYLGSGDQPGNIISRVILRADNYLAWSRAVTTALKARRKYVFIDGTITKPVEKKKLLDWDTVHSMLISWIIGTIDPKLVATVPYFDDAKKLWDYLAKRLCIANGPRLQQLRAAIIECKQTKGMSVEDYYSTLMGLYISRLKPLHGCTCGLCTCDVSGKFEQDREEEKFHQFLIGIDDDLYGIVRSNLLSRVPLPTIDEALMAFTQEERSRGIARGRVVQDDGQNQAFLLQAERSKSQFDNLNRSKLYCSNCKKSGHDLASCFKIHGYPEWWEERNRKGKNTTAASSSSTAAASRGKRGMARANAVSSGNEEHAGSASMDSSENAKTLADLGPEQVQALLNLINPNRVNRMTGPSFEEPDWMR